MNEIDSQKRLTQPMIDRKHSAMAALSALSDVQDGTPSPVTGRSRAGSQDNASVFRSSLQSRQAINSPAPESRHKDYNRYKYYDKLRTSFIGHIQSNKSDQEQVNMMDHSSYFGEFLRPPSHVIDQQLFVLKIPFTKDCKSTLNFLTCLNLCIFIVS